MAARACWHGFLPLSLVSIAVDVFNAEDRKADISFHQTHKPTGKRIHYTKTVEGVGEVPADDVVSGYEVEKDLNVMIVWDTGTWEPTGDARKALSAGKLSFRLSG